MNPFPPMMEPNSSSGWGQSGSSSSSGWGQGPVASASGSGWNSCPAATSGWGQRNESSSSDAAAASQSSQRAISPKPLSSWARAVSGSNTGTQVVGNCSSNSRSPHCDKNCTPESSKTTTTELEKEIRSSVPSQVDPVLLQAENWGQTVSTRPVSGWGV